LQKFDCSFNRCQLTPIRQKIILHIKRTNGTGLPRQIHSASRLFFSIVILTWLPSAIAADTAASEYSVKAAIIYKIAKFVAWPEDAFSSRNDPLPVCLPNADPMGPAMDALAGKIVWGRPIAVRRLEDISTVEADCKILFLSQASADSQMKIVSNVANAPILTIGESRDFINLGGIVTLEIENSRVQFAINVAASERAGLNISAQLLQLANLKNGG
jgi:hypothetical protein